MSQRGASGCCSHHLPTALAHTGLLPVSMACGACHLLVLTIAAVQSVRAALEMRESLAIRLHTEDDHLNNQLSLVLSAMAIDSSSLIAQHKQVWLSMTIWVAGWCIARMPPEQCAAAHSRHMLCVAAQRQEAFLVPLRSRQH